MSKIANKKPTEIKMPVRISATRYELWYAEPMLLGSIEKRKNVWHTADGMRFVSSRDALEYLVRIGKGAREGKLPNPAQVLRKIEEEKQKHLQEVRDSVAVKKKDMAPTTPMRHNVSEGVAINQNHPLFQKFLEFVEFSNRRNEVQK